MVAGVVHSPEKTEKAIGMFLLVYCYSVVKVLMCSRGGGSASEVETHKNIDSVLHTKTTFQAHSIFSVSIQK